MNSHQWFQRGFVGVVAAGACTFGGAVSAAEINQSGSLVEMCARAHKEVLHDMGALSVTMSATERDKTGAADKVNRTMSQALDWVKKTYPAIVFEQPSYTTEQERDNSGQLLNKWTVQQSYQLSAARLEDLSQAAAHMQGLGITVGSMSTYLSAEGRRATVRELDEMAFADVKAQIASVAKAFGQSPNDWRVAHMNTLPSNPCHGQLSSVYAASPLMHKSADVVRERVGTADLIAGRESLSVNFYIALRAK